MNKWIFSLLILLTLSCGHEERPKDIGVAYFDVAGYFNKEAKRLQKLNPTISKQVLVKGKAETKNLAITDWQTELASFSNADINKTSWRGEFSESVKKEVTTYITNNPKIPIKKIEVLKVANQITGIKIFKLSENALYTATDTLLYYPDSLYVIKNEQKIKLLSPKKYQVIGLFN